MFASLTSTARVFSTACLIAGLSISAFAQGKSGQHRPVDPAGLQRLESATGGKARISVHPANGAARFIGLSKDAKGSLVPEVDSSASAEAKSSYFFNKHASVFGISDPNGDLRLLPSREARGLAKGLENQAGKHLDYQQFYKGVPVFAGLLKTHFDDEGNLRSVNGNVVPNISINPNPSRSAGQAAAEAISIVSKEKDIKTPLTAADAQLFVFQAGLAKGVDLGTYLTWRVTVTNGTSVREFVFIDAHTGKFVDQITGTPDDLYRRAYDGKSLPTVPPSYPNAPFWEEGSAFPTGVTEADNMIIASKETYDYFLKSFGRDSFDAAGRKLDSIFNRGYGCPNASWNGAFISFCAGFTTDDVTAHEWGHAYTEYTHGLIYQWQPGALNESYSDIWGETVDRINGRGTDSPFTARTAGTCSSFSPPKGVLTVSSPQAIAGNYAAQSAQFGPALSSTGVSGAVVVAQPVLACSALTNAADVNGKIALVDRGTCNFTVKVKNAQLAGATAVIVANNVPNGLPGMGGADATITIPSLGVTQATGTTIKNAGAAVAAQLHSTAGQVDNSLRWLMGEDVGTNNATGALRDMWDPTCYSNPGKVSDTAYYVCDTGDQGGVHTNSGIPNHAYALLVDGGAYNGQTIASIGLTKAAHIYFRAQSVYQGPASDFADHADALEQSCSDLTGQDLNDLQTGNPSGQIITANDCAQVAKAMLAVEMRTPPTQCGFTPLLAKNPPDRCAVGKTQANIFFDDLETTPAGWAATSQLASTAAPRDWAWTNALPDDRAGSAFFGPDPDIGDCVTSDQSAVLHLDSPEITVPEGAVVPLATFDHWVATEPGWDGGNVKVSVNGGPWQLVTGDKFTYNTYNRAMFTVAQGNTSPLAGERGFSGTDGGSVAGSWGRSHVNLSSYAHPGDRVRLRFDVGSDGCSGRFGWYVDDVTVYACPSSSAPLASVNSVSQAEGNGNGFTTLTFTVTLSEASAQTITVGYKTEKTGTAKNGTDYIPAEGTLIFPPLTLTQTFTVRVKQDSEREGDETFGVFLRNAVNAGIGTGEGAGTILNDD